MRAALIKKKIYLPNHRKNYTSVHYMQKILTGKIKFFTLEQVNWISVPLYDEFQPSNVLNQLNLEETNPKVWKTLRNMMPELDYKGEP